MADLKPEKTQDFLGTKNAKRFLMKPSVKSKVEAVLFSVGHKITLDEISKLCRSRKEDVLQALKELQAEYDEKLSSLMLVEEGESWKFTVRDHLISVVRKIVTETELTKTVMETLAVIAFKYPILQAEVIKLRTNKAYDHLAELEKAGYITRQKHSRTNLIKLTEKFFKYFDLTEEQLKEQFKDFDSIARAIKDKEQEVEKIKEERVQKAKDLKQEDDKIRKEIESLDKADEEFSIPVQTYQSKQEESAPKTQEQVPEFKEEKLESEELLGDLEVVNVPKESKKPREETAEETKPEIKQEVKEEEKPSLSEEPVQNEQQAMETKENEIIHQTTETQTHIDKKERHKKKKREHHGIKLPPEAEARVNERVTEIIRGEDIEDKKEENQQ